MKLLNFDYEVSEIPFKVNDDDEVFMNATEMMRPFPDKRMHNFTRIKSTIEFINALHEDKGATPISVATDSQLVVSKMGGDDRGTWFHEDLALEFARWLSPKFKLWCSKRIQEIITKGFSAATEEATEYIEARMGTGARIINKN